MRREVVVKRGWLLVGAVMLAVLAAGGVVTRELDINRIEAKQAMTQAQQVEDLRRTVRVLCDRGNIDIALIEGALVLIGQRLEDDIRKGEAAAVRADQQFLTEYVKNREKLVREQTDPRSPCAP